MAYLGLVSKFSGKRRVDPLSLDEPERLRTFVYTRKHWDEYSVKEQNNMTEKEKHSVPAPILGYMPSALPPNLIHSMPTLLDCTSPVFLENKSDSEQALISQPRDKVKIPVRTVSEETQEGASLQSDSASKNLLSGDEKSVSQSEDISLQEYMHTTSKVQERDEASTKRKIVLKIKLPKQRLTDGYQEGDICFKPHIQSSHRVETLDNKNWAIYAGIQYNLLNDTKKTLKLKHILLLHAVKFLNDEKLNTELLKKINFDDKFIKTFEDEENILKRFEKRFDKNLNWQSEYLKSNKEKLGNLYNVLNRLFYINNLSHWSLEATLRAAKLNMSKHERLDLQELLSLQLVFERPTKDFENIKELISQRETSPITKDDLQRMRGNKFLENLKDTYKMLRENLNLNFHENVASELKNLKNKERIADNYNKLQYKLKHPKIKKIIPQSIKKPTIIEQSPLKFIGTFVKFELEAQQRVGGKIVIGPKGFIDFEKFRTQAGLSKNALLNTKISTTGTSSLTLSTFMILLQAYQKKNSPHYQNDEDIHLNNDFIKCLEDMKNVMEKYYRITPLYSQGLKWLKDVKAISDKLGKDIFVNDVRPMLDINKSIRQEEFLNKLNEELKQHQQAISSRESVMTGKTRKRKYTEYLQSFTR